MLFRSCGGTGGPTGRRREVRGGERQSGLPVSVPRSGPQLGLVGPAGSAARAIAGGDVDSAVTAAMAAGLLQHGGELHGPDLGPAGPS